MHKDELRQLLTDFTAERLAILQRHEASARVVSHYDFNNTYQYVIARWKPRLAGGSNARNRKMLALILGEMKEHLRMLQQAAEGRQDVLGRHPDGKVTRGTVMAVRPKN